MPHPFDEAFLRRLERLSILSRRALAGEIRGERRSPKRGHSVEFADYRNYTRGDDFRQIDWNAYARLEKFFVKLFVEEEDLTLHLLVDTSRSMDWGTPNKLWYAKRAAAAVGYIALAGLEQVTVSAVSTIVGETMQPRRGRQQAAGLFEFLARLSAGGSTALGSSLVQYTAQVPRPGPLLLISDLFDPAWQDGLRALQARSFEVTILHVLAPEEIAPHMAGDLRLVDSETGQTVEVTADAHGLDHYRETVAAWLDANRQFCCRRSTAYVQVDTAVSFERLIFSLLQRRGILG